MAASGFYDTIGYLRPATAEQLATAGKWLQLLECGAYNNELFKSVPAGIQRLVLLARALVKNPPLLIFDEPTQGLDDHQRNHFKKIIEMLCEHMEVTMIYVTHYEEELPSP